MELGNKIKHLRLKAGITQETLANELAVTYQTISKWENNVCAPDIAMLPRLSIYFGVTIDELFDLTVEDRLKRIENMLDMEQEISHNTFEELIAFLKEQLDKGYQPGRIYSFLAHVYHHRIVSDSDKVTRYAKRSLQLYPGQDDTRWLLQKSMGAYIWDWNARNHHKVIDIFKELADTHPEIGRNYLYLIDNLIADHRTKEAVDYLERYRKLPDHKTVLVCIYEGKIALTEHHTELAEEKFRQLEERFPDCFDALFELAGVYAENCQYEKALKYYEKALAVQEKPRYTDSLEGMAAIYEIQEKYEEAISCYDRILTLLKEDFHFTEGEPVRIAMEEKQRLTDRLMQKNMN